MLKSFPVIRGGCGAALLFFLPALEDECPCASTGVAGLLRRGTGLRSDDRITATCHARRQLSPQHSVLHPAAGRVAVSQVLVKGSRREKEVGRRKCGCT